MMNLRGYSKYLKIFYIALNIVLIFSSILVFVLSSIYKGTEKFELSRLLSAVFLVMVFIFFAINVSKLVIEEITRINISRKISDLINKKMYSSAKDYLQSICKKKHTNKNIQLILYYSGYVELMLENNIVAKKILLQMNVKKINFYNVRLVVSNMFILYMLNYTETNYEEAASIYCFFKEKKNLIMKNSKNRSEIENIFSIMTLLNDKDIEISTKKLESCIYAKLPFIKNYIEKNTASGDNF